MASEFYRHIKAHAQRSPDHPAIIDGDHTLNYSELLEQVERFAGGLSRLKRSPHSKLGIFCLNQKENIVATLGAYLKGVPVVPFNFLLAAEDLAFIAKDAQIDIFLVDAAFLKPETIPLFRMFTNKIVIGDADPAVLGPGTERYADFIANSQREDGSNPHVKADGLPSVIFYTSGTTARPKGVMLDERQFEINCDGILAHLDLNSEDRAIVALPLFHSFGNIMALVLLRVGATLILLRQFAPKAILASIAAHRATLLPLVPTIYSFLVELYARGGYDVSSLRCCISGGASLPEALHNKVKQVLGTAVVEGYGLTETSPVISVNTMQKQVPGSVGPVLPNLKVQIVDEAGQPVDTGQIGEIWVRGETVMKRYWQNPAETEAILTPEGWLKTGDLGHLDAEGYLFISGGRKKDMIIRAGENVSPLGIENALLNHPALAEAAAIGVADERVGEKVKACVVLREGCEATEQELKAFCREKLPAFMVPDLIQFYDALPKNPTGKILKNQLRESS